MGLWIGLGAIQVLRNVVGGGQISWEKSVTKKYGSTLLALRGGGWESNFQKKRYVTLEWPLSQQTANVVGFTFKN